MSDFGRNFLVISEFNSVIFVAANPVFAHNFKILLTFSVILTELVNSQQNFKLNDQQIMIKKKKLAYILFFKDNF